MVITPEILTSFIAPFIGASVNKEEWERLVGKLLAMDVFSFDIDIFNYLLNFSSIESGFSEDNRTILFEIAMEDHIHRTVLNEYMKNEITSIETSYFTKLEEGLEKRAMSEKLRKKISKLIEISKTKPPKKEIGPELSTGFLGSLIQLIQDNLRSFFIDTTPENEYDVQVELYKLLTSHEYKVNWDKDQVTFATKGAKPDFTFPKEKICIEVKILKPGRNKSSIIEEMAADIPQYEKEYHMIIYVLYDTGGIIDNGKPIVDDFEERGHPVLIIKH